MNKTVFAIVIAAVFAAALVGTGVVNAQAPTPQAGNGTGMMAGRGQRGGMMGVGSGNADQDGILHDAMINVFAQKLGITVEDLNTRLAKGETMAQIATSKGLTADQFRTLMTDVRSQAIDQAVKNGTLTQAQADWMKQRGAGMMVGGRGNGARGAGQGQYANPTCPYFQTNP